jgi:hypothetical protein
VQYDIADGCSFLVLLLIVIFAQRDGFFTLYGTGIYVSQCELPMLAQRFVLVFFIKFGFGLLARIWISKKMRRTLLGKPTIHGFSPLAAEARNARSMVANTEGVSVQAHTSRLAAACSAASRLKPRPFSLIA